MIALVTDSTAYFTREEAQQLKITVAPMTYTVDGRLYHETYWGQNGDFEPLLRSNMTELRTSQTSVSTFMSIFSELFQQGCSEILCITLSSRLSGTYSSAVVAAREINAARITVMDSWLTAGAMQLLVEQAAGLLAGAANIADVLARLYALRDKISVTFSVSDLTQLRKSGRLGIIRQSISTILNNKPLFFCSEGAIVSAGVARGRSAQMEGLMRQVPQNAARLIVHFSQQEQHNAQLLGQRLSGAFPQTPVKLRGLGPVLSIHLGFSTLGIAWLCP